MFFSRSFLPFLILLLTKITSAQPTSEKAINIFSYNHIGLAVKNLKVSSTFYREILGLSPIEVPANLVEKRSWFKIGSGQELHLLLGRELPVTNNDKNGGHFSLSIPSGSADKVEQFLKLKQISCHRQQRFDGAWQIYLTDPDGYVIELNEPKP